MKNDVFDRKANFKWIKPPLGNSGIAILSIDGRDVELEYRTNGSSIWFYYDLRWIGYDFTGSFSEDGLTRFDLSRRLGYEYALGQFFDLTEGAIRASSRAGSDKKVSKIKSQMPGKVVKIQVTEGEKVEANQSLLILEAMKMENEIRSPIQGIVKEIKVQPGQAIETGTLLMIVDTE
jgi:acetyl/propionyl-CoA carboxylase alpha subunit